MRTMEYCDVADCPGALEGEPCPRCDPVPLDRINQDRNAKIEYRVRVEQWEGTPHNRITVDAVGPFHSQAEAETFAASFTPPKFERGWVERREVGEWS